MVTGSVSAGTARRRRSFVEVLRRGSRLAPIRGIAFVSRSSVLRRSGYWARAFQDAVDDPRR